MSDNIPPRPAPLSAPQVLDYLDYEMAGFVARRDEVILPAMLHMLAAHPQIEDDATAAMYTENIRLASALVKAATADIATAKRPFADAAKVCDGWRNRFNEPLAAADQQARGRLLDWEQRETARKRAEALQAAREAQERADKEKAAAEAAEARLGLFDPAAQVYRDAAMSSAMAAYDAQTKAQGKAAELRTGTTGHYGARAVTVTRWAYELADWDAVPLEFKMLNDEAIKAAMRDRDPKTGRPRRDIPGIRWTQHETLQVR